MSKIFSLDSSEENQIISQITFGCLIIYEYLCKRFEVVHFVIRKWYTFKLAYTFQIRLSTRWPH